jgi:flagellar motor component MotA
LPPSFRPALFVSVGQAGADYKFPIHGNRDSLSGVVAVIDPIPQGHSMKKLIAAAFALTLLGAGAAEALTIGIHTNNHYRHHRHCTWHHHHQVCR